MIKGKSKVALHGVKFKVTKLQTQAYLNVKMKLVGCKLSTLGDLKKIYKTNFKLPIPFMYKLVKPYTGCNRSKEPSSHRQ